MIKSFCCFCFASIGDQIFFFSFASIGDKNFVFVFVLLWHKLHIWLFITRAKAFYISKKQLMWPLQNPQMSNVTSQPQIVWHVINVSCSQNVTFDLLSDASIEERTNSTCDWNKTRRQWSSSLLHLFCITLHFWNHKMLVFCKTLQCNAIQCAICNPTYMSNPC